MLQSIMLESMVSKPDMLFDREAEWRDLARFLERGDGRLGILWGPRRVGKSFLLQALCDATGGLYVPAIRQDPLLFLASLGRLLGERSGAAAPLHLTDWTTAISALLNLPDTPVVVLDEFPYLVENSPELPTVVQAAFDVRPSQGRLILCGSAVSQMTRLFAVDGPLYRRSGLSLAVRPFDLHTAVRFWDMGGRPVDALTVHAIVGGMPGYHDALGPVGDSVDEWIIDRALDPTTSLFHEDELVFAEDPSIPDANVYRSVLAAVVAGNRTPTSIAQITGRKATSLTRVLDRMIASGLLTRTPDPLRAKRSLLSVGDPFLRFHYAIIRPNQAALARRQAQTVWARSTETFRSQVLGPQFEATCRAAVLDLDLGLPYVADVGASVLRDEATGRNHEVDIVGVDEHDQVVLIGEVKASDGPRGLDDIRRLDRLAALIPASRRARIVHRVLFARSGVEDAARREADGRAEVHVIDAAALCG
jgi:AAA+ ATPase superfamily predicted ATPase